MRFETNLVGRSKDLVLKYINKQMEGDPSIQCGWDATAPRIELQTDDVYKTSKGVYLLDTMPYHGGSERSFDIKFDDVPIRAVYKTLPGLHKINGTLTRYTELFIRFDTDNVTSGKALVTKLLRATREMLDHTQENFVTIYTYNGEWSFFCERSPRSLDTIYLPDGQKDKLWDDIQKFLGEEQLYIDLGIPYKRTYLFTSAFGGLGKTSTVFAIASALKRDIYMMNFSQKIDDIAFIDAISNIEEKSILVIEDIDCLYYKRDKNSSNVSFAQILNALDGLGSKENIITFITTNRMLDLDHALLRPGRIDYVMHFEHCKREQALAMFKNVMKNMDAAGFEYMWEKVKNRKFATSTLQKFLFDHRAETDMSKITKDLTDLISFVDSVSSDAKAVDEEQAKAREMYM